MKISSNYGYLSSAKITQVPKFNTVSFSQNNQDSFEKSSPVAKKTPIWVSVLALFKGDADKERLMQEEKNHILSIIETDNNYDETASDYVKKSIILPKNLKQNYLDAIEGLDNYQYNATIINTFLRRVESQKKLDKLLSDVYEGSNVPYFLYGGYDLLSQPLSEDTVVYRKVYEDNDFKPSWSIGEIFCEKAFTSTSLKKNGADFYLNSQYYGKEPTHLNIILPKGSKVIKSARMKEVLLKNNSSFEIIDFDKNTNTYTMRLL
ncbi:MAG: hypothetical protein E7Z90_06205 [Cyanobacteria bacterium SIG29]|nr:hypothetical protein [Cyanobacteria bacterium SIG29]